MVKGVNRRVIVVKAPDRRLFEQAIFLLREDAVNADGVTADQVVAEAQRVADGYLRRNTGLGRKLSRVPGPVFMALGAGLASLVWGLALFL
ncbi:MAG TPA: translation initiation factor 2 [Candidatus Galloscillospira excrementavium]|nr:translation initiation factor 2 [Candidatus Galloscillospira excrementavium]